MGIIMTSEYVISLKKLVVLIEFSVTFKREI